MQWMNIAWSRTLDSKSSVPPFIRFKFLWSLWNRIGKVCLQNFKEGKTLQWPLCSFSWYIPTGAQHSNFFTNVVLLQFMQSNPSYSRTLSSHSPRLPQFECKKKKNKEIPNSRISGHRKGLEKERTYVYPQVTSSFIHKSTLLLLSRFSCVWLLATPWTVAHQAPCLWNSPGKNTGVGGHFLLQW